MQNIESEWKIPLYKIYSDDDDINSITKIIKRGNRWAIGPEIEELEEKIREYVGCDYCVTFNSGTPARLKRKFSKSLKISKLN